MTYNIQSCRKYKDESVISVKFAGEVIKQYNPDIAGLNEVHGPGGEFGYQVKEIADYVGFPYYFFAPAIKLDGSEYGNAFISKYPIIGKENIKIPDPAVYDGYFDAFSADTVNIGMDEPIEIRLNETKEICEKEGIGKVYADYLNKVCGLILEKYKKRPMFWDDIIFKHPEQLANIPKEAVLMQ